MLFNQNDLGAPEDRKKNKKKSAGKAKWTSEDTKKLAATLIVIMLGTFGLGFMTFCGQVVLK